MLREPSLNWSAIAAQLQGRGLRSVPGPRFVVSMAVLALVCVTAVGAALYSPMVALAVPFAILATYLVLQHPLQAYTVFLCMLSVVPIESRWFGKFVPNWTLLLVPLLVVGAVASAVRRREARRFRLAWADVFVVGFLLIGYAGILVCPGTSTLKYFTKLHGFGALLYFAIRWLPLDRRAFLRQLRWQLLAALWLCATMVAAPLTGFDPSYRGLQRIQLGAPARGPMWSLSDTVAYTTLWVPLFLYAAATALPLLHTRKQSRAWPLAVALAVLASLATTERSGALALIGGLLVCSVHRRMRKYVLAVVLLAAVGTPLWFSTAVGDKVQARLGTLTEEGTGFERRVYRQKALDYIHSPHWNPVLGTGCGRIGERALQTLPPDEWVYDYNHREFRPLTVYASRPTHCAPLALWACFGYGGVCCLLGIAVCVAVAVVQAVLRSRRHATAFDSVLVTALVAAVATTFANGMYHNTEGVVQVLFLLWSSAGMLIGHPEVLTALPGDGTLLVSGLDTE